MAQAPSPEMKQAQMAENALAQSGSSKSNYKGFVAGVFSGIAKLSGKSLRSRCISEY
jgi:solute carrier family 25 carnitine/acylcarnitine transporter 20/29